MRCPAGYNPVAAVLPYSGSVATAPAPAFSAIATNTAAVQQAAPVADTASAGRKLRADEVCAVLNPAESHTRVMACQHYHCTCSMRHLPLVSSHALCTCHVLLHPCSSWPFHAAGGNAGPI